MRTIHGLMVRVKRLTPTATIPTYATDGAACFDLYADFGGHETEFVAAGSARTFHTGLAFEIPAGWCMKVYSRSGHGFKSDTRLANCVGVIDSDYRGEVMVKLTCDAQYFGGLPEGLVVKHGDRIAQAMLEPVTRVGFIDCESLGDTARGTGGLGSTGA